VKRLAAILGLCVLAGASTVAASSFTRASFVRCLNTGENGFEKASQCFAWVDGLSPHLEESVFMVQKLFHRESKRSDRESRFQGPNCYWFALGFHFPEVLSQPKYFSSNEFQRELAENFFLGRRVEAEGDFLDSDLQRGDLLVLEHHFMIRDFDSAGSRHDFPLSSIVHAAVYLGEGMVIQKENRLDRTFSIDTVEAMYSFYSTEEIKNVLKIGGYQSRFTILAYRRL
jgi:hypothetical protein